MALALAMTLRARPGRARCAAAGPPQPCHEGAKLFDVRGWRAVDAKLVLDDLEVVQELGRRVGREEV